MSELPFDPALRAELIQMLAFPRVMARRGLELHDCPHAGLYAGDDGRCRECVHGLECEWLWNHEDSPVLEAKSHAALAEALGFALSYVDAQITWWGHGRRSCACEACEWLRAARDLESRVSRWREGGAAP